jgi:hypothetical protein
MIGTEPFGHAALLHWLVVIAVAGILIYRPWLPRR